jgi:hypothetical protein
VRPPEQIILASELEVELQLSQVWTHDEHGWTSVCDMREPGWERQRLLTRRLGRQLVVRLLWSAKLASAAEHCGSKAGTLSVTAKSH